MTSETKMKPRDIVMFRDEQYGHHRFWEIQGVFLGAEGQESIVELKSLSERAGVSSGSVMHPHTFVPEPLLRAFMIYTPDIAPSVAGAPPLTAEAEKGKTMQPSEGPWRSIANFHCVAPLKGAFIKSGDVVIAEVSARNVGSQEICEANARLLAAAPDMLEALKAIDSEGANADQIGNVTIPSHVWDLVSQALARAEGRTP